MTRGMIQALGLLAGITVMTASLPRALQSIRDRQKAKGESISRNTLMITGNLLWVAYGILTSSAPIVIMCCINAVLIGAILRAALRATRRCCGDGS
jgi:uncharacterized protein with PQ loop repeat